MLKTLGFRRETILGLFVGEAVAIAALAGVVGALTAALFLFFASHAPQVGNLFNFALHEWRFTAPASVGVAILAGLLSSAVPAYFASRTGIVEGLRHIG